jgi:hypothetical protein
LTRVQSLVSFKAQDTLEVKDFKEIPSLIKRIMDLYARSMRDNSFSVRILLPRSKENQKLNNLSKRIGLQIQSTLFLEFKKQKIKVDLREFRYIHDDCHFGWLLIDPEIYITLI